MMILSVCLFVLLLRESRGINSLYRLSSFTTPGNCFGGQICGIQPAVTATDAAGTIVNYLTGRVDVSIYSSLGGDNKGLYVGNCSSATICGTQVQHQIGSALLISGVASFSDLQLRKAAGSYVLRYIGYDSANRIFATAFSNPFNVYVGTPYMMSFQVYPGRATGGLPFAPNPSIAIVDRGNNIITNITLDYNITASLAQAPSSSYILQSLESLDAQVLNGVATWSGLYINEAGYPYQLQFTTTYPLASPTLLSTVFDVSPGPPQYMYIHNESLFDFIQSGEIFPLSPRISVYDAGNNVLTYDSKSQIRAVLLGQTDNIYLSPNTSLAVQLVEGIATFSGLTISKAGGVYAIRFDLYAYSYFAHNYTFMNISVISPFFTVSSGPFRKLVLARPAAQAWAGGQPFKIQPILNVSDYGGSSNSYDFSSAVRVSMAQSLSVERYVFIDAISSSVSTNVTNIQINLSDGNYGVGQIMVFSVDFAYTVHINGSTFPYLITSILDINGFSVNAKYLPSTTVSTRLAFMHIVQSGDYALNVSHFGVNALILNGSTILNDLGQNADILLPSTLRNSVNINTTAPVITNVTTDLVDGEYSVGQTISFFVTFSVPVVVSGTPYFMLSNITRSSAVYAYSSGPRTLVFILTVELNENTTQIALTSSVIQYPVGASILCASDHPTTPADTLLSSYDILFRSMHHISIDTSIPILDSVYGLYSSRSSGIYFAGESIDICVRYSKPVVTNGLSVTLALKCSDTTTAGPCYAVINPNRVDLYRLCFDLSAPVNANVSGLQVFGLSALFVGPEDYLRRDSTSPLLGANLSTASLIGFSLPISLDGFPAVMTAVSIVGSIAPSIHPDDTVLMTTQFSSAVTFNCSPVFKIDVGAIRQATYVSGNGSSLITFKYTVQVGDSSSGLYYSPNALCTDTFCSQYSKCTFLTLSSHPLLVANLAPPSPVRYQKTLLANTTIFPQLLGRVSSIMTVACLHAPGVFSAGEEITFQVSFTDATYLNGSLPMLYLSVNSFAKYTGGDGTKAFTFEYVITSSDASIALNPVALSVQTSAIICNYSTLCSLYNAVGGLVDVDTTLRIIDSKVVIDTTPPRIYKIEPLLFRAMPFTAGDSIPIGIYFDKPVTVQGLFPWLALNLRAHSINTVFRYALYDEEMSTNSILVFVLKVDSGDFSLNLSCNSTSALNMFRPTSRIYATATSLVTEVNYTLPSTMISSLHTLVSIDGITIPHVLSVSTVSLNGRYAAGDTIILQVLFSDVVIANGNSYINLHVGGRLGRAVYIGIDSTGNITTKYSPSTTFYYAYSILAGDDSPLLDYADEFSLFAGQTDSGGFAYIRRYSMNPLIDVDLDLPHPARNGSLASTSSIMIDGSAPILTDISILNNDGVYTVNDIVYIAMKFSAEVVVLHGIPSLTLNTLPIPRQAVYLNGSGSDSLVFRYLPQPGDLAEYLDYASDKSAFFSTAGVFQYNGAEILAKSAAPSLPALISLNPPGGYLLGLTTVSAIAGEVAFNNLSITRPGPNYRLLFQLNGSSTVRTYQDITVSFSSEFEFRPPKAQALDHVGASVAISGGTAVVGAPNTKLSSSVTTEVQTVTTSGIFAAGTFSDIQLIETRVEGQPSMQQFYTTGDIGSELGGFFRIMYGFEGPSRPLPFNADPSMIHAFLAFDIPSLGNVTATKEKYSYCACDNAYVWTLTFHDLQYGRITPISFDTSDLTGQGVQLIGPKVIQEAAILQGYFTLSALNLTSVHIPFDASVEDMTAGLASLGLTPLDISITATDEADDYETDLAGSLAWTVTFANYPGYIPLLQPNSSGLYGANKLNVWTDKLQNASYSTLSGGFILTWRGNTTDLIPYNASASQLKHALESLPVIDTVNVQRCCPSEAFGYTWTVEFVQVKTYNTGNYLLDPVGPLNLMVATSFLVGTDPKIKVVEVRKGTTGAGAGLAYVYEPVGSVWENVYVLQGNDTSQDDNFGCSVSIDNDLILIGAKGASKKGRLEIQSLNCLADSGIFSVTFRSWTTPDIPWNATVDDLQQIFGSDRNADAKTPALNALKVSDWGTGPLCGNQTVFLTFTKPVYGAQAVYGTEAVEVELLTVSRGSLTYANSSADVVLFVQSVQLQVTPRASDPLEQGSAYLFRRQYACNVTANTTCLHPSWVQEAEFYPLGGTGFEQFGISVAVSQNIIAIGCPGTNSYTGSVYIFKPNFNNIGWIFSQELTVSYLSPGDSFGAAIALNNGTLIVGAPFRNNGAGGIFGFRLYPGTEFFVFFQDIPLSRALLPQTNDYFGSSVALHGDFVVVGAKGRDESKIFLGTTMNVAETNTGAVFVYQRESYNAEYLLFQSLVPSNVHDYDGFGYSVSIYDDVIAVGALQDYTGVYLPNKAVYQVTTTADIFQSPVTGSFQLLWETYKTRPILHNITAFDLKRIIENDLHAGKVSVSRSVVNLATQGYHWLITFVEQTDNVTTISADSRGLHGSNATVQIALVSPSPDDIRGVTHVFQRDTSRSQLFVEEAFLSPDFYQPIDLCGASVAATAGAVLVGCPNRDVTLESGLNTGAAFLYDLSVLNLEFASYKYQVVEGGVLPITVQRRSASASDAEAMFYLETIDRDGEPSFQLFMKHLFGIRDQDLLYPETYADASGSVGTARGRSGQYLSSWIGGYYDYKATSDFLIEKSAVSFLSTQSSTSISVLTNDDKILEAPNENFTTVIHSPGLWPSSLGKLLSVATILDNDNGFIANSSTTVYDKLYESQDVFSAGLGTSVSLLDSLGLMAVGVPSVPLNLDDHVGQVILFKRVSGQWVRSLILRSPTPNPNARFGDSVNLARRSKDNTIILAVGEPGINSVQIFVSLTLGRTWYPEAELTTTDAILQQHNFGQYGTVALAENLLVVGAPVLERVYIFYRSLVSPPNTWAWSTPQVLRSSDYDYDVIFGVLTPHPQEFGRSVSYSSRTLVVGSPYALYDKTGSNLIEVNVNTAGMSMKTVAKGKAYIFYSQPTIQKISLNCVLPLRHGSFRLSLNYKDFPVISPIIQYDDTCDSVKAKLESMINIDRVTVRTNHYILDDDSHLYAWTVTFEDDWTTVPLFVPLWNGSGCMNCTAFDGQLNVSSVQAAMEVSLVSAYSAFIQTSELAADDKRSADKFGYTVALDGDQLAVGAIDSAAATTTTWNFEVGTLQGWAATGNAFAHQPTFGDNTYLRAVYRRGAKQSPDGKGQHSNLEGRYFIGTFEKHPGRPDNYLVPDLTYPQGGVQGDEPVGTLTSEVFMIRGSLIGFLIGGGCDERKVYVELLVDGLGVARVTGKCSETMEGASFNVSEYRNRAAQLRIVDASRVKWGHISVDNIRFDWDVDGSLTTGNNNVFPTYGGMIETPRSGAVYMFRRYANNGFKTVADCLENIVTCPWVLESRLTASDKRQGDRFGSSLALNDKAGILVVGAPFATQTGLFKDYLAAYPALNDSAVILPMNSHILPGLQYEYLHSGANSIWGGKQVSTDNSTLLRSGAVYIYVKANAIKGPRGLIVEAQHWYPTEVAKFQPSDIYAGDAFGQALALDGVSLVVGAPGQDASQLDSGAAYFLDLAAAAVSFAQAVYIVYEGHDDFARVSVVRNLAVYSGEIYVDYATTDISATGIDAEKYEPCKQMSSYQRGLHGCGDYRYTRGTLHFPANKNITFFSVPIINDDCLERFPKFIQLNLFIPGSGALAGELASARIRIDDDDFNGLIC